MINDVLASDLEGGADWNLPDLTGGPSLVVESVSVATMSLFRRRA